MTAIEGWKTSSFPSLLHIMKSGGTPNTSHSDYYGGDVLFVSIEDMTASNRHLSSTIKTLTNKGLKHSNAWIVPANSILYSIYATLGLPRINTVPVTTNQAILALINDPKKIDRDYLYYWLEYIRTTVVNYSFQTTQSNLSATIVKSFLVHHPIGLSVQSKIAEILSTVDRAIEQTEALIAKQQRIKTGLMQDLLTRGIDEYGNLRSEQTHKFKDSPLGRIPIEWTYKTLSELYAEIPRNGIFKTPKEIGTGTLMIGQTSFTSNHRINYKLSRKAKVSTNELLAYGLQENDILITRVYATVDGVGLPVLVEAYTEPAVYESNMLRLRVRTDQILSNYVFYWLMSAPIRTFITTSVNASNQTSINQKVVARIPVSLPTKPEQETIVDILAKSEKSIQDNADRLRKLLSQKTALMQDLLTGEKRISALLEET